MQKVLFYIVKISGYLFIFGIILYAILFLANTFSDYVISERYLNSDVVLILTLLFGFISIFQKSKINEK